MYKIPKTTLSPMQKADIRSLKRIKDQDVYNRRANKLISFSELEPSPEEEGFDANEIATRNLLMYN